MSTTQIVTLVDFEKPGKQLGRLAIPQSTNTSGWATEYLPIAVINGAPGPTALLFGGNHGDEYEGPVTLLKLAHTLEPDSIRGRIIMLPMLNRPALAAGARLSPLDGKNMNRVFPGRADGTITEMIAHYVTTVLFPLADLVIDIHSGGRSAHFLPLVSMHHVPNTEQLRAMIDLALAWGAPYILIYRDVGGTGLLPGEAERLGKLTLGTEMGSAAQFGVEMLNLTEQGVRNVLRQAGMLIDRAPDPPPAPPQLMAADQYDDYIMAPVSGIFEPFVEMGAWIVAGQTIGQIHSIEQPFEPPTPVSARTEGLLISRRAFPLVRQGDCLATLARPFRLP
ncbi:MAG: succinylglutamate desuccinylase/aspartoacylase family protein [Roseiflexus sp.]|nr:succinylglutamate desuccinylase/aspartoacylase family protein [Roseiflexus sp.]MDW8145484.1 succinylglutamate desuccinylase/aspartoacylase family protein [Roseiflexaceae bacterium]